MDMYTQMNVFVGGMREGQIRPLLERAEPSTLDEAFSNALRENFRVTMAYTKPSMSPFPGLLAQKLWRLT